MPSIIGRPRPTAIRLLKLSPMNTRGRMNMVATLTWRVQKPRIPKNRPRARTRNTHSGVWDRICNKLMAETPLSGARPVVIGAVVRLHAGAARSWNNLTQGAGSFADAESHYRQCRKSQNTRSQRPGPDPEKSSKLI